jgi:uncharacterized cupin superfamily protein
MEKVNLKDIEERPRQSPNGKFGRASKDISIALGRDPESFDLRKRHLCPYHSHSAESELYLVVAGKGSVRDKDGSTIVTAGDAFFFGPGEAHQLANAGEEDFVYYVIADNPRGDSCYYPDSGKFAVMKEGSAEVIVKGTEINYFDGEE